MHFLCRDLGQHRIIELSPKQKNIQPKTSDTFQNLLARHENMAEIHTSGGNVYKSLISLERPESTLGDSFLKVHRSRPVSVMAIHDITDKVNLNNGGQR